MSQVLIPFDKSVTDLLGDSQEQIARSAREFIVLELYRRHTISAGRAAEFLGLDEFAFIRWSGALGIPYFDTTPEELRQELLVLENL